MTRRAVAGVAVVLAAVAAATLLWTGAAAPAEPGGSQPPLTSPEGFANAEFEIRVYENGSARWTVRATRPLENQTEIDSFRSFADTFESTETDAFRNFRLRAQRLVSFGTNATGREMNATGFARDARVVELGQTRGVVELSFLWTNFARADGDRVIVDDVFQGGMFVDAGQRLVIARGPGLTFESVDPPPDSRSEAGDLTASETVTWLGERDFPDQRPRAVFAPAGSAGGDGAPAAGTDTPTPEAGGSGGLGMLPLVIGAVVLLGLAGGFALYSGAVGDVRPRRSGEPSPGADAGAAEPSGSGGAVPPDVSSAIPDEERVLQLLDANGGRMKQVEIVEETDWSKSKVSMLLSDMEESGEISKLRVGRENIISKAGQEPDAASSPFEDE